MTWTWKEKLTLWTVIIPGAIAVLVLVVVTGAWLPIILVMILVAVCRNKG